MQSELPIPKFAVYFNIWKRGIYTMAEPVEFFRAMSGPVGGDQTACYSVTFRGEPPTVGDFIQAVLKKYPGEWGGFSIRDYERKRIEHVCMAYKYGALNGHIPEEFRGMKIKEVKASGGWSCMDYSLFV